jgi:hypothetical protein
MPGVLFDNVEKRGYRTSGQSGSEPSGNGNETPLRDNSKSETSTKTVDFVEELGVPETLFRKLPPTLDFLFFCLEKALR